MSRGLGRIQLKLLAILDEHPCVDTYVAARLLYRPDASGSVILTAAQVKATHRALRGLLACDRVEAFGRNSHGRMQWRKRGSRQADIDRAVATLEEIHSREGFAAARRAEWRLRAAMLNHTSLRDFAGVLGVSKSTAARIRQRNDCQPTRAPLARIRADDGESDG
jgi:hypothetical protein